MEILKERYQQLMQPYSQFERIIKRFLEILDTIQSKSCNIDDYYCIAYRDSVIKRFEFCYDLTWKFLKLYLENNYGIEVASPKKVFQECIKQNLVPADKANLLLDIVEARNNTSHIYDEETAHDIAQKIPQYYELLFQIIKNISL